MTDQTLRHRHFPLRAAALAGLALLAHPNALRAEDVHPACEKGTAIAAGFCVEATLTADGFVNASGGVRRGGAAIGQLRLGAEMDFERLLGLQGWQGAVSAFAIHGRQPTPALVGSLAPVSNIEALSTLRLFELWLQRDVGEWGSIRFGQLAADAEFGVAAAGSNLVNGTFGWPVPLATSQPAGGPAYPLATPGIRLNLGDPGNGTGLRVAVFSGDAGGKYGEETDPQRHNRYGINFSLAGGILYIAELATGAAAPEDAENAPRPWAIKLGGWYHNGGFDSLRIASDGLPLTDPASTGVPRRFGNNYGCYAVGEVTLWRGEAGNVAIFARGFTQPDDRNAVSLQLDGGVAWHGPFGRKEDTLSLGASWARIGNDARDYDRDQVAFGAVRPVRDHETVVEANYDIAVLPGRLSVRPLVQALFNPAARAPDERRNATRALPDALLLGMRMTAPF